MRMGRNRPGKLTPGPIMQPPMPHLPFFLASFAWNYALGMTWLVVPLYAHAKGLSGAELGILFSLPAVAQLAITLVGGAYVDRVGGRRIMLASSVLLAAGAAAMPFARDFWTLFAAQLILVLARATFWPANWAIASELPGAHGVQAGRLNAVSSLGQILGNGSCGFVLALGGFDVTFGVLAALAVAALLLGLRTPAKPRTPVRRPSAVRQLPDPDPHAGASLRGDVRLPVGAAVLAVAVVLPAAAAIPGLRRGGLRACCSRCGRWAASAPGC